MKRCVNIDWLEMYCIEPSAPRDILYFEAHGFCVSERSYGTKHWAQVFTLLDNIGNEFMEVRRSPRHAEGKSHTIYPDGACNLRLVNRYCYYDTAAWLMADFIGKHRYEIRRIYRLDLCIDFKRFDTGDTPENVARRIARHTYAKIYQSERTIHGRDYWTHCDDNSFSWGKKGSMIVTRFYNKSLELAGVKDKPWIRQSWYEAGLISDPIAPILLNQKGEVIGEPVWRLEFQINSSARGWFVIDGEHKNEYVEHTLEAYWNRPLITQAIACLIGHYFKFSIYRQGVPKHKCPRKELFRFTDVDTHYTLRNSLTTRAYDSSGNQALRWIARLRTMYPNLDVSKALDVVEAKVRTMVKVATNYDGDDPEISRLRALFPDVTRGRSDEDVRELFDGVF